MKKLFNKGSYLYYAMANGMFYFSFGMFNAIISVYLAGVGCSATEISFVVSAAPLFSIVTQPITGYLADKFRSPQKVGMLCLSLAAISGILFAYTKNYFFLFLLNGFTQGLLNGTTSLSDRLATYGPYPFGTIRIWGSILYATAAQISGLVYDNISPTANYYIFIVGIILTIIGFIGMHDAKPVIKDHKDKVTTKEVIKALWHNRPFKIFVLIFFIYQGIASTQMIYQPLLMQKLGGTTTLYGTTLLLSTLSEIPMVLFSDKIMKRFSYRNLIMFASVMGFIRYAWYSTCPDPNLMMIVFFLQGVTSIVIILVAVRIVMEIVDERYVNSAYGISSMLARGVSVLLFQMVSGQLVDAISGLKGYTIIYYVFAAGMVITFILGYFFKMPKSHHNFD